MNSTLPLDNKIQSDSFAADILEGLTQQPKKLSSKYFYDANGDKLFQDIMNMPEYYLTDCEFEIFETKKDAILSLIGQEEFDLVELGAGDGTKTKVLLEYFLEQNANFTYSPIDISGHVLDLLKKDLCDNLPDLHCNPIEGDYFEVLNRLSKQTNVKKVVLFLGANIGNLSLIESRNFLSQLYQNMTKGDILIIGFDLKKDPTVILDAYNDPKGITAAFNLNLLKRINNELNANFKLDGFKHWETYNPITGATKSYLISNQDQKVSIGKLNKTIHFKAWEAIDMELSQKYDLPTIEKMAQLAGFRVLKHLTDSRQYFVDTVWQKC